MKRRRRGRDAGLGAAPAAPAPGAGQARRPIPARMDRLPRRGFGDAVFIGVLLALYINHYYGISFGQMLWLGCSAVLVVIGIASQGDKCKVRPPPCWSNGMPVANSAPTTTRRGGEEGNHSTISTEELANLGGPKKFTYKELGIRTKSFASDQKLGGGGGSGVMYKGHIGKARTPVIVKQLTSGSPQGIRREYKSAVKSLSQLRHRNVLRLIGYCHEVNEFFLVYEFPRHGSLKHHLFKDRPVLGWKTRYDIAQGLASALHYLHKQSHQCVIHGDIKSNNVMLDEDLVAKLGGFGKAQLVDHTREPNTTQVKGTPGYMAPEYVQMGKLSEESDIYSFGVVLLEIGSGRRAVDRERDPQHLVEWVWKRYEIGKLRDAVDSRLRNHERQAKALMMTGLWFAHPNAGSRPSIEEVVDILNLKAEPRELPAKMPAYKVRGRSRPAAHGFKRMPQ